MTAHVEIRTRLIRPMTRETLSVERFEHSHWRKATREEFSSLWDAECAAVPEFSESSFHIITGLLLPIWDRLPSADMRVYRFETDDGERVIGRLIAPEAIASLYQALGVDSAPGLSSPEAWRAVIDRGAVLDLAGDLQIRRSLVMGAHRVELTGYSDGAVPQLKALGLTSEIIAWRLRLFVPISRGSRTGNSGAHSSTAIRCCAPVPVPPPDDEMNRDQRRRRSGAPPRARRRGRVPPLPLQRTPFGMLLDYRRCYEHAGPKSLCAACTVPITARARLANGPMPRPASTAISSI